MSHKVHPKSFRIKGMEDWVVRGFYDKKMRRYMEEDFLMREFLIKKLGDASVASVEIERSTNKINIIIYTARPGVIIGRGGGGVDKLKEDMEKMVSKKMKERKSDKMAAEKSDKKEIKVEIREVKNPWTSAALIAQMSAQQIEKRMPFRQVMKKTIERVMSNKEVKGIRMEMAGRLNGIEIARKEWLNQGQLPRNTLRADIDYAQTQAFCTYGTIGIKVWLYKGEKFE